LIYKNKNANKELQVQNWFKFGSKSVLNLSVHDIEKE